MRGPLKLTPVDVFETRLALRAMMNPERAADVDTSNLSPLTAELIELIALAPTLCREIGPVYLVASCFQDYPDREMPPVLEYAAWLASTPRKVRESIPPFDEVVRDLERLRENRKAA